MKLKYYYNNGKVTEHTTYISNKTILKEAEEAEEAEVSARATKVYIYKVTNNYDSDGEQIEKYITTLGLH